MSELLSHIRAVVARNRLLYVLNCEEIFRGRSFSWKYLGEDLCGLSSEFRKVLTLVFDWFETIFGNDSVAGVIFVLVIVTFTAER